jgi:hypothetical protein
MARSRAVTVGRVLWAGTLLLLGSYASAPAQGTGALAPGSLAARWPIKTSVPAAADLTHPQDLPLAKLVGLQDVPGVKKADSRYTKTRIPDPMDGLHEGEIVRTKGWVHLIALESDGDYHIQVSKDSTSGDHCLIVELPSDNPAFESDPKLRALERPLRLMLRTKLLHDPNREPGTLGNWIPRAYMSISGQLFFDDWHVGDPPRGKSPNGHHMKAATLWEIHPITDIRFSPKPIQRPASAAHDRGLGAGAEALGRRRSAGSGLACEVARDGRAQRVAAATIGQAHAPQMPVEVTGAQEIGVDQLIESRRPVASGS